MILDTSAGIAILCNEDEAAEFEELLERSPGNKISVATYVEAGCVIDKFRDPLVSRRLDELLGVAACVIEPVTEKQAGLATGLPRLW